MDIIVTIIMSFFLGMIPEVIYFTLFLTYAKNIKEKRLLLGTLIGIFYILCLFVQRYKVIYYILFICLIYLAMKLLYKKKIQIIDIFLIGISYLYLTLISFFMFIILNKDLSNYYILFLISRIMLILPFIFKKYFHSLYTKYYSLWNRNDTSNRPIKSITLRNVSLIALNIIIFIINLLCLNIINI